MSKVTGNDPKGTLYCSFCGKSPHEVRKLIAGPTVFGSIWMRISAPILLHDFNSPSQCVGSRSRTAASAY